MPPPEKLITQIANAISDVDGDRWTHGWTDRWMDRGNTLCPFHHSSNGRGKNSYRRPLFLVLPSNESIFSSRYKFFPLNEPHVWRAQLQGRQLSIKVVSLCNLLAKSFRCRIDKSFPWKQSTHLSFMNRILAATYTCIWSEFSFNPFIPTD